MGAALSIADRVDDPHCRGWCLCLLCNLKVRRHDVEAVRLLSTQARTAATRAGEPIWVAASTFAMAWVAWKDNCIEEVLGFANEAQRLWGNLAVASGLPSRYKAVGLWPLISVQLSLGCVAEAVEAGCQLFDPSAITHADEVESLLQSAKAAWDRGEEDAAANELRRAVELASRLGCC